MNSALFSSGLGEVLIIKGSISFVLCYFLLRALAQKNRKNNSSSRKNNELSPLFSTMRKGRERAVNEIKTSTQSEIEFLIWLSHSRKPVWAGKIYNSQ